MASVSVKNISNHYAGQNRRGETELKDVSFEVADRSFAVLVGPPGCGTSAILRMMAGLDNIPRGEIHIGDKRVNDVSPKDRDVAMVFRDYALYPHMSVYDNLAFGLKTRKFSATERKRRVSDAASLVGIDSLLSQKPGTLDTIQQLRVALGRTIVRQPKVFLFDNPLSNLAPSGREEMRAELIKLHQRLRATMIYVAQEPIEAMMMADQVVVMNAGTVEQADTPLTVYQQPANLFVAKYFGDSPMNFVAGTLKRDNDKLRFNESQGGTISIFLAINDHPELQNFSDRTVVLAIRPEDLQVVKLSRKEARDAGNSFPAVVDLIEPTGAEANLYLNTGAHSLMCRSREFIDRHEAGHRVQFEMDLARALFFDPETTKRLL